VQVDNVPCNLCGGEETFHLFSGLERRFGLGGSFNVVQCQGCGLVYLNPRPTGRELRRYYPADRYFAYRKVVGQHGFVRSIRLGLKRVVLAEYKGYPHGQAPPGFPLPGTSLVTAPLRNLFQGLPEYVEGGKLLDVGCGSGNYLCSLRELGWDVYGVEIDDGAASYARDQFGLKVSSGTLEEAGFPDAFFHVVTMRQVLEHLPDPFRTAMEAYRVLEDPGTLIVEVPNFESFQAALFQDKWFHLDLPRHLYHFSPRTLRTMLYQAGLSSITISHLATTSGITGSLQYIWNAWTQDPTGNRIRWSKPLGLCLWPLAFLMAKLGYGEMLRAIALKQKGDEDGFQ